MHNINNITIGNVTTDTPLFCNVVLIREEVISDNYLVVGIDTTEVVARAEDKLLELCKSYVSEYNNMSGTEIDDILSDGYIMLEDGGSICITWPELV